MNTRDKFLLGVLGVVGTAWGVKTWLRRKRQIELFDRVVVITGASSGHGFILAQVAAEQGARLVIAARDSQALEKARTDLLERGARSVLVVPTDVREPQQAQRLIDRAIDHYGGIDVLINNAGIITVGPVEAMHLGDFHDAMATNFWGAVHTTMAVLPQMKKQGFGRIANVSSQGGKSAFPHMLPYTTSKFALTGFTEGLRAELVKDNILVTGIYPATMRTGGHTHARFKGNHEAEYAWFGAGDSLPLISTSARHVASTLLRAVCNGDPEVLVGWPTHLTAILNGLFPSLTAELRALAIHALPEPTNLDAPDIQGKDLRGTIPNLLNRAVPEQARPETA